MRQLPDAICVEAMVSTVFNGRVLFKDSILYCWFVEHVQERLVHLYNTRSMWRREIDKDDPRPWLFDWITHWADAFEKNPHEYMVRHPHRCFVM